MQSLASGPSVRALPPRTRLRSVGQIGGTRVRDRSRWVLGLAAAARRQLPAAAHHSFAAIFDSAKPVKVTGTVTRIEWMNPHTWIYLDVKNGDGAVEAWAFKTR